MTFREQADPRISERETENLHPKLTKRRSSHLNLPATDDEDDAIEVRPVTHLSRRTRRRFETRSCSVDYFTLRNREMSIKKVRGLTREEIQIDKDEDLSVNIPLQTRPRSNSSIEVSEWRYQNQHLTGTSASDLPATDDEDDVLEERPVYSPGRKRNRFQVYSCPSNYYSPINDTKIKPVFQTDKAMLHVPMQPRFRSHSASELSESVSEHQHLNRSQSRSSVFSGEEEEVFVDSPIHFSNLERRGRFQALSGSSDVFTPRICSPEGTDTEESEIDKSRQNDMQVRNLLQIPAELRRRSNSTTENSAEETLKPNQHPKLSKRRSSESDALKRAEEPSMVDDFRYGRRRAQSFHTSSDYFIYRSGKLTENAKKLSQEEIHSLEIDIFKPLDFFEILFERMKITDSKTSMDQNHTLE